MKKILNHFISQSIVDSAQSLLDIDFQDHSCQVPNTELMVGFTTKQALHGVQGNLEPRVVQKKFSGVFAFYTGASHYLVNKFNRNDEVLINARFVDFQKRKSCSFASVEYLLIVSLSTFQFRKLTVCLMSSGYTRDCLQCHQK